MQKNFSIYLSLMIWIGLVFTDAALCAEAPNPLVLMDIPSSPNPVGSGARALGMGGAFIAIADDATAASWNPGGLIQLGKPEMSIVGGGISRKDYNEFNTHSEASGEQRNDKYSLNYLSAAYPFQVQKYNMIVSLNYQHMYDFKREWNFSYLDPAPIYDGMQQYHYEQNGALYALGAAYSVQITPDIFAGVTLNYWGDFIFQNEWEQSYHQEGKLKSLTGIQGFFSADKKEKYSFEGWNAVFGFLWRITKHWTMGGVLKTPFTADIHHDIATENTQSFTGNPTIHRTASQEYDEKLKMPLSYGIGLAYRFSDNFTISGDFYRTHWNDFELQDSQGHSTSPVSGKDMSISDINPTTWFRLGVEYLIIDEKIVIPLRGGIFYDPAPAEGSADDYYGFSLGTGLVYNHFIFDIAYQFRFGNNTDSMQMSDVSQDVREHRIYTSLIIHY